ncbi:MAG: hypothetical protein V1787_04345 [Candidatus Micrarchaeota archaeon]
MESLNVAVISPEKSRAVEFCRKIGKGGSAEDIMFYSAVRENRIWTLMAPAAYPEKLTAAAFAMSAADYTVLLVDKLDAFAGELILLADALACSKGCILSPAGRAALEPLVKGTSLEGIEVVGSEDEALAGIAAYRPARPQGTMQAAIDHCFDVKGVGVVALGLVSRGVLKVHSRPWLFPLERLVEVRSLQEHDVDLKEVGAGSRFGAALKGVDAKDVERGFLLAEKKEDAAATDEIELDLAAVRFLREPVAAGSSLHAICGLQALPCRISGELKAGETKRVRLVLEKRAAFAKGARVVLADLNRKPRVVASGRV